MILSTIFAATAGAVGAVIGIRFVLLMLGLAAAGVASVRISSWMMSNMDKWGGGSIEPGKVFPVMIFIGSTGIFVTCHAAVAAGAGAVGGVTEYFISLFS